MMMETRKLQPKLTDFTLPQSMEPRDATVAIPVSKGIQQRYFFLNLRTGKGLLIEYPKRSGLLTVDALAFLYHLCSFVANRDHRFFSKLRTVFGRYHNGISFFEVAFKLSKPHGITYLGDQKYLVSLWSSSNYFVIDIANRTIEARTSPKSDQPQDAFKKVARLLAAKERQEVFSTYQYFDEEKKESYFAQRIRERGIGGADLDALTSIRKFNWRSGELSEIWRGKFGKATHYISLNRDRSYLGLIQFGDFYDEDRKLLPSKILILDLRNGKECWIDNAGWSPSAHIDWDPVELDTCYLSCHNGVITPVDNPIKFFFQKVYKWKLFGAASIHKYRITENGPKKIGIFTHPELLRLTIHKVFQHRKRKILVCTGSPNNVFFADADSLKFWKLIRLKEESGKDSVLGSLFPSPDGEKVFLITMESFQILDVESGRVDFLYGLGKIHDPFNHMISVNDTDW